MSAPDPPAGTNATGRSPTRIPPEQVSAVTVTFNPTLEDGRLGAQIEAVSRRFGFHVIVDNHSQNFAQIAETAARHATDSSRVHVIGLDQNLGIAHALNEGVASCRKRGDPAWVLTLDQDTTFPDPAFTRFDEELSRLGELDRVGILGFNYLEHRFNSTRPYNHSSGPLSVRSIITSGNLVRTSLFDQLRFDEGLFLYFVDVDFCRKVRSLGYSIVVLRQALIDHAEGRRKEGSDRPRFYLDPSRLYYLSRNGCVMFARYLTLQDPIIVGYLVAMNLIAGGQPFASIREAIRGALAAPSFLRSKT